MPSYAEYLKQQRPPCWGRESAYDSDDSECRGCRFEHSCRAKVQSEDRDRTAFHTVPIRDREAEYDYQNRKTRQEPDTGSPVEYKGSFIDKRNSEIVPEGQRPWERFAKDGATGALRGLFGEFYNFFRHYRIP
jgi:hypothetical protein